MQKAQQQQQQQRPKQRNASSQRSRQPQRGPPRASPSSSSSAGKVSAPVAISTVRRMQRPRTTPLKDGDIRISHREYFADLNGSVAFASNANAINPGLPSVFPWLSAIAQRYESYVFRRLKFCFETESATSTTGTLLLSVDYDASDAAPASKSQALAYRSSVRSPPWAACCHDSLPEDLGKRKSLFVRSGGLSANQDIKLYDTGNLFACTQGQAGATTVGELYVEYIIDLMTPQLGPISIGQAVYGAFTGSVNSAPFATFTGTLPATVVSSGTTTSVSTFTFTSPWEGYVALMLSGTGIVSSTATGTATSLETQEVENAAATAGMATYTLSANVGSTFILTIANTTIGASILTFGQADV